LFFVFCFYLDFVSLCSGGGGGLDVVHIQELLEVEVGQLVRGGHAQQRAQLGIRVDVVLVLQVVLLHIGGHILGHIGAALLRAGRAAHECAQLRGNLHGNLEDRHASRLGGITLHLVLALALVSHLLDLARLLLQTLGLSHKLRHHLPQGEQARGQALHLGLQAQLGGLSGLSGLSGSHHGGGDRGRGHSHRLGLGLLGLGGGHRGRGSHGGRLLGLLRIRLLGDSLGGGSGVHYTSGGDRSRGHFTRMPFRSSM